MNDCERYIRLLYELCGIPAPSHHEEKRARFIEAWLKSEGAETVYTDEAKNVVFPFGCEGSDDITVIMAHTDTVFPDTVPMPIKTEGGRLYCPAVGDDTANVVVMLAAASYAIGRGQPSSGILFVANSCEEGLGNLKGCRQLMNDYAERIKRVISFDGEPNAITNGAVGSHRYEITINTAGGHSFSKFGAPNAIAIMSDLICRLYGISVPKLGDSRTTYNVGCINGGTSVNAIAQSASALYEYRSDSKECLEIMKQSFESVCKSFSERGIDIRIKPIGIRPCSGDVDKERQLELTNFCADIIEKHFSVRPTCVASSTDCNIPLSLGIPAVAFGTVETSGAHTREEYVVLDSIKKGIDAAKEIVGSFYKN